MAGKFAHALRLAAASALLIAPAVTIPAAAQASAPSLSFVEGWSQGAFAQDAGKPIAESSAMVANLDGQAAVVVGDRAGYLYAYHLSDGSSVAGWPVFDGGAPIDSTPSAAELSGTAATVFIGTGDAMAPGVGGYSAYAAGGQLLWHTTVQNPASDPHPAYGVQASLTVAGLQDATDVFAGSLGQEAYALSGTSGTVLSGWPFFTADSDFSTAAAGDLYGTGQQELVVGGASTAGLAMGQSYPQGGHVRVLNAQGQLIYDYDTTQEVDSSPAIGNFLTGGATGIVIGTGSYWPGASDTDALKAFTTRLGLVWSDTLDGLTASSPALADVEGDGQLDVVEGTDTGTGGSVWALSGATGAPIWHEPVAGRVIGSVVTADLTGQGYQDLLVPTVHGVEVLDGRSGAEVTVLGPDLGFQNSPLVTDDPDGNIGVTIAGYNGNNEGVIQHYYIAGSDGALAVGAGSWPMFHHDPSLTGIAAPLPDIGALVPSNLSAVAGDGQVSLSWAAPVPSSAGPATGYNVYESTSPGHEKGLPVNGATPILGTTFTATGLASGQKYYFEVTAINEAGEGAPSNEANAVPSASVIVPAAPAMPQATGAPAPSPPATREVPPATTPATTPATAPQLTPPSTTAPTTATLPPPPPAGYRLATASGRVFSFGWLSSYPLAHPSSPVVGIATTPSSRGYWLALRDGEVLAAGDARVYQQRQGKKAISPATEAIAARIAGIAPTADGKGYWLLAADGSVYAFGDAAYYGSLDKRLNGATAVGIAPGRDGRGYWLVTTDGAIYGFGDARVYGSLHERARKQRRNRGEVVAIAPTPDARGYWVALADGAVFGFGDAEVFGSLASLHAGGDVTGLAATADGQGYWLTTAHGAVYGFGDAHVYGGLGAKTHQRVVAISA